MKNIKFLIVQIQYQRNRDKNTNHELIRTLKAVRICESILKLILDRIPHNPRNTRCYKHGNTDYSHKECFLHEVRNVNILKSQHRQNRNRESHIACLYKYKHRIQTDNRHYHHFFQRIFRKKKLKSEKKHGKSHDKLIFQVTRIKSK